MLSARVCAIIVLCSEIATHGEMEVININKTQAMYVYGPRPFEIVIYGLTHSELISGEGPITSIAAKKALDRVVPKKDQRKYLSSPFMMRTIRE